MAEGKAKPKSGSKLRAGKPREPGGNSKPAPPAGAKAKPDAEAQRATGDAASSLIDGRIRSLGGWRGATLAEVRRMIREADPEIVEEWKWMGTPVWSRAGNICTGEAYKQVVKLTFARGASVEDPRGLFNSSLEGNTRRAIDIREGEALDAGAFKALIRAAVAENLRVGAAKAKLPPKPAVNSKPGVRDAKPVTMREGGKVVLLAGGNPQIAKEDGEAPVRAYIAAMPGWKRGIGERLDALIVRSVPGVRKAVKWNSPFYGIEGRGWFVSFHVFTRYVKVTFFRGASLRPVPPGGTGKDARWIDIHEDDLDEVRMAAWIEQAGALPGWMP